jgi:hypothetical protein
MAVLENLFSGTRLLIHIGISTVICKALSPAQGQMYILVLI